MLGLNNTINNDVTTLYYRQSGRVSGSQNESIKSEKTSYQRSPISDMFIKNYNNISFGGKTSFANKFEPFEKEFREYCGKHSTFTIDELQKIVKKYLPNYEVKNMSELGKGSNVHDRTGAYIRDMVYFTEEGKVRNGEKELYLYLPNNTSKEELSRFHASFVHEVTHGFQENSSDRIAKIQWLEKFLQNRNLDNKTMNILSLFPKFFTMIEYNLTLPLAEFLRKENEIPIPINNADAKMLDNIFIKKTGALVDDYIDYIINATANKLGFPNEPADQKKVIEYVNLIAQKELEAHTKGINYTKKTENITSLTDMDLLIKLYEKLVERTDFWIKFYSQIK